MTSPFEPKKAFSYAPAVLKENLRVDGSFVPTVWVEMCTFYSRLENAAAADRRAVADDAGFPDLCNVIMQHVPNHGAGRSLVELTRQARDLIYAPGELVR